MVSHEFIGEVVGTAILVLLGDGVVANAILNKTKGNNSGWIVITTGWAMAVFVGAYAVDSLSGAHLNPAISVGLAVAGKFAWAQVPVYVMGQMLGAIIGAALVWMAYLPHWKGTEDKSAKLAVFCTAPAIRNAPANFFTEVVGTAVLMFGILAIKSSAIDTTPSPIPIDPGAMGSLPVAFLVWGIGLSLGGPTGYAINPARDLGPRIAHAILPIAGKGGSDWGYSWIPVFGPLAGGALGSALYIAMGSF